jgi:hypothetical protein
MTQRLQPAQKTFISYNRGTVPARKVLTADVFRIGVVKCNVSIPLCITQIPVITSKTTLCFCHRPVFGWKMIIIRLLQNLKNQGKMLLLAEVLKYYRIFITLKVWVLVLCCISNRLYSHCGNKLAVS